MTYTSSDITYHNSDLEKIQLVPTMYIGATDTTGITTILREVLDNALDEAKSLKTPHIKVWMKGADFYVWDGGRGIPIGIHPKAKKSTLEVVLTTLQSSGKRDASGDGAYSSTIGTHGVGLKATNALSKTFQVWTCQNKQFYTLQFKSGKVVKSSYLAQENPPVFPDEIQHKAGTVVHFTPDLSVFDTTASENWKLDVRKGLFSWCEITAYMNPGIRISVFFADKVKDYYEPEGISSLITKRIKDAGAAMIGEALVYSSSTMDLALAFTDTEGSHVYGYTNTIRNLEGGVHINAFNTAITNALLGYKSAKQDFSPIEAREGIIGILNVKISAPQFDSQTKEKLVDSRAGPMCSSEIQKVLEIFFTKEKALAKLLCERAANLKRFIADFKENKRLARALKPSATKPLLPVKLTQCPKATPDQRELFIVEGDSAGGTAKFARNKAYQEVLPLRGKIQNANRTTLAKILASEETLGILQAIGYNPSEQNPTANLRVNRVMLLADPDTDGAHINLLVLALLYRFVPALFSQERVFVVEAAEFMAKVNGMRIYGNSLDDLAAQNNGVLPTTAQHFKGWGEATPETLRELAFQPDSRIVTKITSPLDFGKEFRLIMDKDPAHRKEMLGI